MPAFEDLAPWAPSFEDLVRQGVLDDSSMSVIERAEERRGAVDRPELRPDSWDEGQPVWFTDCWDRVLLLRQDPFTQNKLTAIDRSIRPRLCNGLLGVQVPPLGSTQ